MANSRTIEFKGHFDGKQVLDELKKIRQSMADAGADDNLFKGIDKDIAATEKLVTEMMAQIQKGFSNTKEVNAFEKQIDKLQTNFLKISSGMQNINIAENFGLNSPEINKLTKEIEQLTAAQDHLKEVSKNALDQAQKSIGLRNDEVAEIKKAIDANEDLEEALKKVGKAKEKAALANVGSNAAKTDAGKEYLSKASIGLSLDDLGAKASSGNTAKAKNDARKRYDNGELYGSAGNRELDETKANAAINEVYQKTLEKMVTTGGNAAEAIEEMKKALADYGIEIENVDKLQENFYSDIEGFYKSPAVSGGAKSAVTKARKIGQTDAQGNYQLSENSMTNLVNNEEITASTRAEQELTQKIRERGEAEKKAQEEGTQAANKHSESLQDVNKNIEDSSQALKEGSDATRDAAENQNKLNDSFDNMKGAIKTFLSIGSAISALRNVVSNTFNDIKELDKSFANIAMVTDYSVGQMWESYDQYAEMANELGQSTKSVIEASGLFYQQGLDTADSLALTEDTMKLATLAGLDFAEATSQMTAALRGFHMEMNEGGRVTDVYSELAAKAAADVEGIAYAMSKTASIASSAGMEFETTSAFLTQMIETTQEAPENIGTAMKTIIARFTELKENVAGTADSEFEDLDYNKVDTALKSVGISLKDASGQFRNLDDVFLELSEKWNTLDRNSQRYIATIAAGSRQQSRFIAMMENYDRTMELVDTAYDSAGKSSEQFAKYQDTVEYKMNQLQNTWEQFRTQFFNSDFFKTVLDGFNALLGKINELSGGDLLALGAAIVILGKTVGISLISGIQTALNKLPRLINDKLNKALKGSQKDIHLSADITNAKEKIKELEKQQEELEKELGNMRANIDISKAEAQLEELEKKASETGLTPEEDNQMTQLKNQINDQENKEKEISQNLQNQETEKNKQKELEAKQQLAEKDYAAIGQTAAVAFSAAFTTVATDMNPGAAVATVLSTGIMSSMPTIISSLKAAWTVAGTEGGASFLTSFITSSGGIMLIVVAAIAAIAGLVALAQTLDAKEEAKQFDKRYAEAKKLAEESKKQAEEQRSKARKATEEADNAKELKDRYEELHNQTIRTTEEQEEYNELVQQIQEQFPQIITSYNEITGELEVQNDLWDKIIEKSEILAKQERREATAAELTATNDQLVVDQMSAIKDSYGDMDIFANSGAAKENLNEFEKFVKGEMNFDDTNMSRALQQIEKEGIETQIKEDSDTSYDKITNTDKLIAYGASVLSMGTAIPTIGLAMDSQEQKNNEALAALDYNAVADLIGYQPEPGKVLKFDASGNATIIDEFGNAVSASETDLESFQDAILDSETGLEAQIEKQKELINQEQELAEKQAALTYATQYVSDYEQNLGEELAAGQKEFMTGVIANMADEFDGDAEQYLPSGNNKFFDALGGARSGASDNSLSDWGDIDSSNVIEGIDKELLKQAGFEGKFTGDDVKNLLIDIKGSEEEASKFWEENQGTTSGQLAIQQAILTALKTKGNDQILADLDNIDWSEINTSYERMLEDGATQEEINAYNDAIEVQRQAALDRGQTDLAGWIGDYGQDTLEKYNKIFEDADKSFTNLNKMGEVTTKHLEVFTQQAQNVEDILGSSQLGLDYVNEMNKLILDSGITDPSVITNALSAFDTSSITAFNKDEIKQQFIDSMSESMNSEEAGKLWENFFALSEDYNLVNIEISSVDILEQGIDESYDKIAEQLSGASSISDAITAQLEKGFLNFSESNELRKTLDEVGLNFEDYFVFDDNGESFIDFDKLKDDYKELLPTAEDFKQQALDSLDAAIEEVDLQIDMIKALQSQGDRNFQNLKITEATTEQLKVQLAYMEKLGYITIEEGFFEKNATTLTIDEDDIKLSKTETEILEDLNSKRDKYLEQKEEIESGKNMEIYEEMTEKAVEELESMFDITGELTEKEEDLTKATEDLAKAQKEYDEALHGTAEWLDSQDPFQALSDSISILEKKLEGLKEDLNNITTPEQSKDILNAITENRTMQIENLTGQIQASQSQYEQVLDFIQNGDYSQYYSQLPDGTIAFDITKWYNEGGSDEMGDALGEMATKGNDAVMQILESQQKINSIQDEQQKESEERLKNYTSLQDQILDILKKNAEEEVKTQKEKYENLKQADDDYLSALEDAIEKQRQLREQEKDYEELATKEKKLSLMQRDTSGANQKEINQLQQEVENQRQELLDNKIDEMIDKLREQSELQTEMRDLEIEIKENELESNNFLSELAAVESSFHNTDDIVEWMLKNNKELEDMSIEQQEAKILEWQELGTSWAAYLGEKEEGYSNLLTTSEENIENFAQIGVDAIEGSINRIITNEEAAQLERENNAKKALEEAEKNYNKAVGLLEDYWEKAAQIEKNKEKNKKESNMQEEYDNYMKNAHNASFEGYLRTQGLDVQEYQKYKKYSPNASQDSFLASKGINIKTKQGYVPTKQEENNKSSNPLYNEINKEKTNVKEIVRSNKEKIYGNSYSVVKQTLSRSGYKSTKPGLYSRGIELVFDTGETLFYEGTTVDNEIINILDSMSNKVHGIQTKMYSRDGISSGKKYATGGLVNYTGPAWVDGTPTKPEAFLNAQDTQRIGEAAKILAQIPALNGASENVSTNIGDTTIEIHINVENIESDYDVDQMIERVKNDIIDVSKPIGTSVILKK
jgi:TP901 family phage tail tape measure protein